MTVHLQNAFHQKLLAPSIRKEWPHLFRDRPIMLYADNSSSGVVQLLTNSTAGKFFNSPLFTKRVTEQFFCFLKVKSMLRGHHFKKMVEVTDEFHYGCVCLEEWQLFWIADVQLFLIFFTKLIGIFSNDLCKLIHFLSTVTYQLNYQRQQNDVGFDTLLYFECLFCNCQSIIKAQNTVFQFCSTVFHVSDIYMVKI